MADDITKILKKASRFDRVKLLEILRNIREKNLEGLDVKKITGEKNQFRVRSGQYRILFEKTDNSIVIKWVKRRNENTY